MSEKQEKPAWMKDDLADKRVQKKAAEVEGLLAQLRVQQQRALGEEPMTSKSDDPMKHATKVDTHE